MVVTNNKALGQVGHEQKNRRRAWAPYRASLQTYPPLVAVIEVTHEMAVSDCVCPSFEREPCEYGRARRNQDPSDRAVELGVTRREATGLPDGRPTDSVKFEHLIEVSFNIVSACRQLKDHSCPVDLSE